MDPDLLSIFDASAEVKQRGRSAVIREAVTIWLRRRREHQIVEAYQQGYQKDGDLGEDWEDWEEQGTWPDD